MRSLSDTRKQAEEALRYESSVASVRNDEGRCEHLISALLALLAATAPGGDTIEHPCGCYAPDGDVCYRHAQPPRPAQDAVGEAAEEAQQAQRYDIEFTGGAYSEYRSMEPAPDGDWVKADVLDALLYALAAARGGGE